MEEARLSQYVTLAGGGGVGRKKVHTLAGILIHIMLRVFLFVRSLDE